MITNNTEIMRHSDNYEDDDEKTRRKWTMKNDSLDSKVFLYGVLPFLYYEEVRLGLSQPLSKTNQSLLWVNQRPTKLERFPLILHEIHKDVNPMLAQHYLKSKHKRSTYSLGRRSGKTLSIVLFLYHKLMNDLEYLPNKVSVVFCTGRRNKRYMEEGWNTLVEQRRDMKVQFLTIDDGIELLEPKYDYILFDDAFWGPIVPSIMRILNRPYLRTIHIMTAHNEFSFQFSRIVVFTDPDESPFITFDETDDEGTEIEIPQIDQSVQEEEDDDGCLTGNLFNH